jgi:hypothetical protein
MNGSVRTFLKGVAASHVGHLLLILNLCLIAYEYSQSPTMLPESGDCFTVGEAMIRGTLPAWFVLSKIINGPALLLTMLIASPLQLLFPDMCIHTAGQINATTFVFLSSIQWMLVGYGIGSYSSAIYKPKRRT